jgi:hypothetical protein
MIRALVLRKLDSVEKELGASVDHLRYMVGVSLRAFFKFARILPLAQYRRDPRIGIRGLLGTHCAFDARWRNIVPS